MTDNDKTAAARGLLKTHRDETDSMHGELVKLHPACQTDLHDAKKKLDAACVSYEDDVLGSITTNG